MQKIKPIAFYLPQYHPIPENDAWWGKGFTEWANVSRSKPQFKRHNQPRIPTDMGFYDLRIKEVRTEQASLAKAYGLYGFMYYHYWFKGKQLLERPVKEILETGEPDFPFCLCWANETWSRRWLGEEKEVLLHQEYSPEDDKRHGIWLAKAFADPRYIKVNGRPLFAIYRPTDFPDPKATIERIKETVVKQGLPEPYIIGSNSHAQHIDTRQFGIDAILNFEPQLGVLPEFNRDQWSWRRLLRNIKQGIIHPGLKIYNYKEAKLLMQQRELNYPYYPCVMVGWDNTPRRGENAIIIKDQNVPEFKASLKWALEKLNEYKEYLEDQIIFINAWNEWAEGNYLEPCLEHGHSYLEAVKEFFGNENG